MKVMMRCGGSLSKKTSLLNDLDEQLGSLLVLAEELQRSAHGRELLELAAAALSDAWQTDSRTRPLLPRMLRLADFAGVPAAAAAAVAALEKLLPPGRKARRRAARAEAAREAAQDELRRLERDVAEAWEVVKKSREERRRAAAEAAGGGALVLHARGALDDRQERLEREVSQALAGLVAAVSRPHTPRELDLAKRILRRAAEKEDS